MHGRRARGGRDPDDGGARRAGDRSVRGLRTGPRRPVRVEEREVLAEGVRRGGDGALGNPSDGGQPLLGDRSDAAGGRDAAGRSRRGVRPARGAGDRPVRGGCGREPGDGGARGEPASRGGERPHPLQRRRAGHRGVRDGAWSDPRRRRRGETDPRVRGRDEAVPSGFPADRVGTDEGRHPVHPDHGQHGGFPLRRRKDRRRRGRGGSHRRERRRGEQNRHLRRRRPVQGAQGPVLRGRAGVHHRPVDRHVEEDPDRGARSVRGDAPDGETGGAPRGLRVQPRLRRDTGPLRFRHRDRERGPEASPGARPPEPVPLNPPARAAKNPPTADRLREIGVRDTARTLSLLSELLQRLPREHAGWESIYRAAAAAPDPDLFFLNLSRWVDSLPGALLSRAFARDDLLPLIGALLGGSEFIPEQIARRPGIFEALFIEDGVLRRPAPGELERAALAAADRCATEEELKADLRRMKHMEIARIAARDLSGIAPLPEVTEDLSLLASAALEAAVRFSRRALDERLGLPIVLLPDGTRRLGRFVVMGMGKLGALELNFSSDIDLVYLYETDQGGTEGTARSVSLHEYFARLGEAVSRIVSEATEDGFVFRVDLRLRPEGTRGELANSLRSAEIYYESWGQTWERAALIKARPVAGDRSLGEEFLRSVVPFVYRKYLVFTAIEEIKGMKDRINLAAARALRSDRDVKLGLGGIREIEFFAQAHQLIYGGKEPKLRLRGTMETISALSRMEIVTEEEREGLPGAPPPPPPLPPRLPAPPA